MNKGDSQKLRRRLRTYEWAAGRASAPLRRARLADLFELWIRQFADASNPPSTLPEGISSSLGGAQLRPPGSDLRGALVLIGRRFEGEETKDGVRVSVGSGAPDWEIHFQRARVISLGTEAAPEPPPRPDTVDEDFLMHAEDFRDGRRDRDLEVQSESLAELLRIFFRRQSDGEMVERDVVAALNRSLPRRLHLVVPPLVLRSAANLLQEDAGTSAMGDTLSITLPEIGETGRTWTLDLRTGTVETRLLPSSTTATPETHQLGSEGSSSRLELTTSLTASISRTKQSPMGSRTTLEPGLIVGPYQLQDLAGRGGMGQVWKAVRSDDESRRVALKTFRRPEKSLLEGLERELRILRSLRRSDYFPLVHDALEEHGRLWIVMDWISGSDLKQHLSSPAHLQSVTRRVLIDWLGQITDRLNFLHSWQPRPIVFRDLKPANVMVDPSGQEPLRLIDFGISHLVAVDGADKVRRGSHGYVAPEIREGKVSPLADVFSLGRLALFMMFGHERFNEIGAGSRPLAHEARGLTKEFVAAVLRLCAPEPSDRPTTVLIAHNSLKAVRGAASRPKRSSTDLDPCHTCGAEFLRAALFCSQCGQERDGGDEPTTPEAPVDTLVEFDTRAPAGGPPAGFDWSRLRAWRSLVELRASADLTKLVCLGQIKVQPYEYQREAAVHVLRAMHGRALIADDVGLGKTIEAGLIIKEYLVRGLVRRCLVVCPPNLLLRQFQRELREKFGLQFAEYRSTGDVDGRERIIGPKGLKKKELVIVSHHRLRRKDTTPLFEGIQWDLVVMDECHHMRNHTKLLARAMRRVTAHSRFRVFLSATPFSGKVDELWSVYNTLEPGVLGSTPREFHDRFCYRQRGDKTWIPDPDSIREVTQPLTIRRRRADLLIAFPGRQARRLPVDLSEDRPLYQRFAAAVAALTNNALIRHQLLQQFCSSFESLHVSTAFRDMPWELQAEIRKRGDESHPKVRRLLRDVIPRLPEQEPILLFTRYRASQRSLERILAARGVRARALLGRDKVQTVTGFQRGDFRVLIAGEGAGEGLNLQFCSLMINFDLPWNPMRIEQRIGRIQRIGQLRREVSVVNLVMEETIEDRVLELLEAKLRLFRNLQGETEQILGELLAAEGASLEAWLAGMLMRDGSVSEREFARRSKDIDRARRKAEQRTKSAGKASDDLLGRSLGESAPDAATPKGPELKPLDLSALFSEEQPRGEAR